MAAPAEPTPLPTPTFLDLVSGTVGLHVFVIRRGYGILWFQHDGRTYVLPWWIPDIFPLPPGYRLPISSMSEVPAGKVKLFLES